MGESRDMVIPCSCTFRDCVPARYNKFPPKGAKASLLEGEEYQGVVVSGQAATSQEGRHQARGTGRKKRINQMQQKPGEDRMCGLTFHYLQT